MDDRLELSINYIHRSIHVAGSPAAVAEWWERLSDERAALAASALAQAQGSQSQQISSAPPTAAKQIGSAITLPENFGEFLHGFPQTVTDIERALIAAFFVQSRSDNNSFTTANVNELLQENAIRLANPSNSIKRNLESRRVFSVGQGQFRVSQTGIDHLVRLQSDQHKEQP